MGGGTSCTRLLFASFTLERPSRGKRKDKMLLPPGHSRLLPFLVDEYYAFVFPCSQGDVKVRGLDPGGQDSGSSLTTPALTTRQRKLRSRPQQNQQDHRRQQHHSQHPLHDARRDKVSQSLVRGRVRVAVWLCGCWGNVEKD